MNQSDLKARLAYDPDSGNFTWLSSGSGRNLNKPIGWTDRDGYLRITVMQKSYGAHRLAWLYMTGSMPKDKIDHKNRDRSDNRFENLRECTQSENMRNKFFNKSQTGVKGVFPCPGNTFRVRLWLGGRNIGFGTYADIELAELVAIEARMKHHGEFANHGA